MTLVSVQKPQRHFRRGPPNLQMRAPDGDAQERRQAQAQRRAEAVGEAGWGAEAQRDGLRYRQRQRWSECGNQCFLVFYFFFYKEKVLISVFFVSSAYPRGAGRLLARPLAAPRVAFTSEPELGAACSIHTPVPALSILVSLPAAGGAQGPSHHRALNLLARRQSSPPGLPRRQ